MSRAIDGMIAVGALLFAIMAVACIVGVTALVGAKRDEPASDAMRWSWENTIVTGAYEWTIEGWEHNWVLAHPGITICNAARSFCEWVELPGPKVLR